MLRPGGYECITYPDRVVQHDTATCAHCNKVFRVGVHERAEDIGGLCKSCMKLICPSCVGLSCDPIEEKLKRWEARQDALRSYGM